MNESVAQSIGLIIGGALAGILLSIPLRHSLRRVSKVAVTIRALLVIQTAIFLAILLFVTAAVAIVGERPELSPGVFLVGIGLVELVTVLSLARATRIASWREGLERDLELRRRQPPQADGAGDSMLYRSVRRMELVWMKLVLRR